MRTKNIYFCTYDPKQPPLHVEDRYHVAGILHHVREEECSQPVRRIEVRAHVAERPEETLHREKRYVILDGSHMSKRSPCDGKDMATRTNNAYVKNPPAVRERFAMKYTITLKMNIFDAENGMSAKVFAIGIAAGR